MRDFGVLGLEEVFITLLCSRLRDLCRRGASKDKKWCVTSRKQHLLEITEQMHICTYKLTETVAAYISMHKTYISSSHRKSQHREGKVLAKELFANAIW